MSIFARGVASLIATMFLLLGSAQVQAQQTMSLHEFTRADSFVCNGQTMPGGSLFIEVDSKTTTSQLASFFPVGSSDRAFIESFSTELEFMLNRGTRLDSVIGQWRPTGKVRSVFGLPAQGQAVPEGFMTVHRVYIPETCSHNFVSMDEKIMGTKVQDLAGGRFLRDSDGPRYMVRKPTVSTVAGADVLCPTGTRPMYLAFSGPKHRRFTSWVEAENNSQLPGWADANVWKTLFPTEGVHCAPAEAQALWVVNDNPDGVVNDPVQGLMGKYLSVFDLNPADWNQSVRTDVVTVGRSRSVDFDNSRNAAYMPRGTVGTTQAKAVLTVSTVANVPDSRLNALVYEPTGEVFHLATGGYGNRVFVYNPKTDQIWDFIAPTGVVPNFDSNVDANVQGAIYGDTLFRVLSVNGHTQTKVEVYDIPTRTQRASYMINKKLANGGGIFAARPQISFDPRANALWFAALFDGSLGYLELTSGNFTDIPILQESGIAVGATDVEIDTSRKVAYVSVARFRAVWQGVGTPWVNGSLAEFDLPTKQIVRQTQVQVYPAGVAILPTVTGTFVAVTNSANQVVNGGNVGSVSVIDTATFTEVGRMQTQRFPTATVVDFKD